MKLSVYLGKLAKREFLKEFNIYAYFTRNVVGYSLNEDSIVVYFRDGKEKELKNLPYPMHYFNECFKTGYHMKHRSTWRKVKKSVYKIVVHCSDGTHNEKLTIRTTNIGIYDYIKRQYDAIDFIEDNLITYEDKTLCMKDKFISGIGISEKKVKFKNIIEYENFQEEVTLITK